MHQKKIRAAIFETSSPSDPDLLAKGLAIIEKEFPGILPDLSFIARTGRVPHPYLAGEDRGQAGTFSAILADPGITFIWAARGGYGALRWTERVSWPPSFPAIVGFSDVTVLHAASARMGAFSIHGPMVATLPATSMSSRQALWKAMTDGTFPDIHGMTGGPGAATGRLIGGNLACLSSLVGTPIEPPWEGSILFLEEVNEPLYRIDRMITHLLLSGRLEHVRGVAAGQFSRKRDEQEAITEVLLERLAPLPIPVVVDLPCGHGTENMPLLLGGTYRLDGSAGLLSPEEALEIP